MSKKSSLVKTSDLEDDEMDERWPDDEEIEIDVSNMSQEELDAFVLDIHENIEQDMAEEQVWAVGGLVLDDDLNRVAQTWLDFPFSARVPYAPEPTKQQRSISPKRFGLAEDALEID